METIALIDLEPIAKQLTLPLPGVQRAAELLDEGNTVPFITRFRKDQTGGLDEQQVRAIEKEINRAKLLAERKETVRKSIESRGKLTPELAKQIAGAQTIRLVEDMYLPYKPKKQSLAAQARARGLEPLASEIIASSIDADDLARRAAESVDSANDLPDQNAVMDGIQYLIAEHFGNHAQLRAQLRKHLWRRGLLVSKKTDESDVDVGTGDEDSEDAPDERVVAADVATAAQDEPSSEPKAQTSPAVAEATGNDEGKPAESGAPEGAVGPSEPVEPSESATSEVPTSPDASTKPTLTETTETTATETATSDSVEPAVSPVDSDSVDSDSAIPASENASPTVEGAPTAPSETNGSEAADKDATPADVASAEGAKAKPKVESAKQDKASRRDQRRATRRRRRERLVQSFKDYFDFSDPIGRIPHHRILAINRGERTKVLRVRIECSDWDKVHAEAESTLIPADHRHGELMKKCLQDAMSRLLLPSIEREVRRELNDRAEEHAVKVFARNLRKLLLQPPLHHHRVVAIDPGFRSGCKVIALDEFGQMLGHTFINLVGKDQQKQESRDSLVKFVTEHSATVIAIGNGTACRETESLVADVLSGELKDKDVAYLIVNEAGTGAYSTSDLGREELPNYDATVRGAISIGRRSIDPLSELVKIDPASIGVGLYQHDVKAKHLRESLDAVVESCVNYVGVDVNSASPALLRYVSGLNSLTARRIYEHRQQNGPFKNREQLKEVSGIGESTYVQAAGFLKIAGGENPLDGTWIHPESYPIASRVLAANGFGVDDLRPPNVRHEVAQAPAPIEAAPVAESAAPVESPPAPVVPDSETPQPQDVNSEQVAAASEVASADIPSADIPSSEVSSPEVSSPEVSSPEVSSPEVASSEVASPEVASPEVASSDAANPEVASDQNTSSIEAEPTSATESPAAAQPADTNSVVPDPPPSAIEERVSPKQSQRLSELSEKMAAVDVDELAAKLDVGKLLLNDILSAIARPGRDPREDLPPPIFRRGILKLEDLKPGMELSGTVLNVVDFGAFVDIGLVDSGLVHVSRLADRFVSDPHDVVSVGDILRVWVVEVDQKRRRVSLTAIEPGTEREKPTGEPRRQRTRNPRPAKSAEGGKPAFKGKKFAKGKGQRPAQFKRKSKPKPVVPITKEMEEGSQPMRTFGDLKQLFEKRKRD